VPTTIVTTTSTTTTTTITFCPLPPFPGFQSPPPSPSYSEGLIVATTSVQTLADLLAQISTAILAI
jgi:hypothetical protein